MENTSRDRPWRPEKFLTPEWFDLSRSIASVHCTGTMQDMSPAINVTVTDPRATDIVREYHMYIDDASALRFEPGPHPNAEAVFEVDDYSVWASDFVNGEPGRRTLSTGKGAFRRLRAQSRITSMLANSRLLALMAKVAKEPSASILENLRSATLGSESFSRPLTAKLRDAKQSANLSEQLAEVESKMPALAQTLRRHIELDYYLGAQFFVSRYGERIVDGAVGLMDPERLMTAWSILPVFCCVKPITALGIAKLWEDERLDLSTKVSQIISEFACGNKQDITIHNLLTHSTPVDTDPLLVGDCWGRDRSFQEALRKSCAIVVDPDVRPDRTATYSIHWAWTVLGEIIERTSGMAPEKYLADNILAPLGMTGTYLRTPPDVLDALNGRLSDHYIFEDGSRNTMFRGTDGSANTLATRYDPSTLGSSNARDMARLLNFLAGFHHPARRPVTRQTAAAMTARHRAGLQEAGDIWRDYGLGVELEARFYYKGDALNGSFGPRCSHRTFGHHSLGAGVMYADPVFGITAVLLPNTVILGRKDKVRSFSKAVYDDLLGRSTQGDTERAATAD